MQREATGWAQERVKEVLGWWRKGIVRAAFPVSSQLISRFSNVKCSLVVLEGTCGNSAFSYWSWSVYCQCSCQYRLPIKTVNTGYQCRLSMHRCRILMQTVSEVRLLVQAVCAAVNVHCWRQLKVVWTIVKKINIYGMEMDLHDASGNTL
jgi:hypothetical protein